MIRRVNGASLRKWIVRLVVVGAVVGGLGGVARLLRRPPVPVKWVSVERGMVRDVVTSSSAGEIAPEKRASVRAEIPARVIAVRHRRGERVKQGDSIIVCDAADLDARLAQARASLQAATAQLQQAKARVTTLGRQAERARMLSDRGAGTAQVLDDANNLVAEAREAERAAQGALSQAQAAIKVAEVARQKSVLTAPFDGILVDVSVDVGETLVPGVPPFEIIDDHRLHVDAAVDEADASRVAIGQPALLTLDALPGKKIAGRVSHVAPAVRHDLKGARMLPIEVEVADVAAALGTGLRVGMSTNVEIVVAEKQNVAWLPTHVIVGRGTKRTVYRLPSDSGSPKIVSVEEIAVEVGVSNWDRAEILSGLQPGDRVVANLNAAGLSNGASVKIE